MPVRPAHVVAAVVTLGVVGGGIAFAMSGDDDSPTGPRGPWTDPVVPPQTPEEILALKQLLCTCYRGGATEVEALTLCALKQVYADVPWPAQPGDHASLAMVTNTVRLTAADLIRQPNAAARDAWCGVVVDPPKPDPTNPTGPQTPREWGELLFATSWGPGKLVRISNAANNPSMGGIERAAKAVFSAAGIPMPDYSKLVRPYMQSLSAGPRWNRPLYGRPAKHDANNDERPYASAGVIIKPAWLPRNDDAHTKVLTNERVVRTITASGGKAGGGSSYGAVWAPTFDVALAKSAGVLDLIDVDPPASFLDLLGM